MLSAASRPSARLQPPSNDAPPADRPSPALLRQPARVRPAARHAAARIFPAPLPAAHHSAAVFAAALHAAADAPASHSSTSRRTTTNDEPSNSSAANHASAKLCYEPALEASRQAGLSCKTAKTSLQPGCQANPRGRNKKSDSSAGAVAASGTEVSASNQQGLLQPETATEQQELRDPKCPTSGLSYKAHHQGSKAPGSETSCHEKRTEHVV